MRVGDNRKMSALALRTPGAGSQRHDPLNAADREQRAGRSRRRATAGEHGCRQRKTSLPAKVKKGDACSHRAQEECAAPTPLHQLLTSTPPCCFPGELRGVFSLGVNRARTMTLEAPRGVIVMKQFLQGSDDKVMVIAGKWDQQKIGKV